MRKVFNLIKDSRGATAIEYALVASLVSIAAIVAFNNLGTAVEAKFNSINQAV